MIVDRYAGVAFSATNGQLMEMARAFMADETVILSHDERKAIVAQLVTATREAVESVLTTTREAPPLPPLRSADDVRTFMQETR